MLRAAVGVLLVSSFSVEAALRGNIRDLQVSVNLPGVSINVPSSGSPSVSVGGSSDNSTSSSGTGITIGGGSNGISIGGGNGVSVGGGNSGISITNGTISIGGQPIVSWGNGSTSSATCDNLPSTSLKDEPTCETALPAFYNATTDANFTTASKSTKVKVMDDFCGTKCGQVFTARTVATRLHCNREHPGDTDVASGIITAPNISAGSGVSVVIPGLVNVTVPGTTNSTNRRQLAVDDKLQPSFSPEFPGLYLGCIKDTVNNEYCAVKVADPSEKECDFYLSCCYAELNAITTIDLDKAAFIESKCPGSTVYRLGTLCTA